MTGYRVRGMGVLSLVVAWGLFSGLAQASGPRGSFPLSQTRLLDGEFRAAMQVNRGTLDEIGVERALYSFRVQAGLPTGEAEPLGGWASPEPGGAFPGFFEGHYLSAIALTYAQTGDPALLRRVEGMVAGLAECQAAMGGSYLFASPEVDFNADRLDGVAWYRMHKLLEGLLAAHTQAGNRQALAVAVRLAEWIKTRQELYTANGEWPKVKRVEYGGMQEALMNLYIATGNAVYQSMSREWEERGKLQSFEQGRDVVGGHANTELAKMVGAALTAQFEQDPFYLEAVRTFWEHVAGSGGRCYATGGTSVHEGFPGARALADTQARFAQETCCSYNLQKITRHLFLITGELRYMDHFERTLFNSILGSQDPETGWKSYYQPLNANTVKDFRSHITGCFCCNGTGLENFAKFGESLYSHDGDTLQVNLFIASAVRWEGKGVTLEQRTAFPAEEGTTLTVHAASPTPFSLAVRVPGWCTEGFAVRVNGETQPVGAEPSTYSTLHRTWRQGDVIEVSLPMTFSRMAMPDRATQLAFLRGPVVLVGEGARPFGSELVADPADPSSWIHDLDRWFKPVEGDPLAYTGTDDAGRTIRFRPYSQIGADQFFTGYWDLVPQAQREDEGNVALGKATWSSTDDPLGNNVEAFMRSAKAVDGNYGGSDDWYVKWFPGGMAPQWIVVDLGTPHDLTQVEWYPAVEDTRAGKIYRYRVETSVDRETWDPYADREDNQEAASPYRDTAAARARYVRFTFLAQPEYQENLGRPKLAELKVFGTPVPRQP